MIQANRTTARRPAADPNAPTTPARPLNFVAEVNGHQIYRADDGVRCDVYTPGVGWWALGLSEEAARRNCRVVSPKRRG